MTEHVQTKIPISVSKKSCSFWQFLRLVRTAFSCALGCKRLFKAVRCSLATGVGTDQLGWQGDGIGVSSPGEFFSEEPKEYTVYICVMDKWTCQI